MALDKWVRLAARFCLAGQMFSYGAAKAVPLQFQLPPSKLVEPLGDLSPMGLLWAQTGFLEAVPDAARLCGDRGRAAAHRPAHGVAGRAGVGDGKDLLLNLTFDVPVKVHSFHLLLLSLLAPHTPRLTEALLTERPVPAAVPADLFRSRRANRIATALQAGAGLWLLRRTAATTGRSGRTTGADGRSPGMRRLGRHRLLHRRRTRTPP